MCVGVHALCVFREAAGFVCTHPSGAPVKQEMSASDLEPRILQVTREDGKYQTPGNSGGQTPVGQDERDSRHRYFGFFRRPSSDATTPPQRSLAAGVIDRILALGTPTRPALPTALGGGSNTKPVQTPVSTTPPVQTPRSATPEQTPPSARSGERYNISIQSRGVIIVFITKVCNIALLSRYWLHVCPSLSLLAPCMPSHNCTCTPMACMPSHNCTCTPIARILPKWVPPQVHRICA